MYDYGPPDREARGADGLPHALFNIGVCIHCSKKRDEHRIVEHLIADDARNIRRLEFKICAYIHPEGKVVINRQLDAVSDRRAAIEATKRKHSLE